MSNQCVYQTEMKKLLFVTFILSAVCFSCKKQQDPAFIAASAAKDYYDMLLHGKYDSYVAGMFQPNSIPDSYQKQLVTNAKMFMEEQKEEHNGIKKVRVVDAKADTVRHV